MADVETWKYPSWWADATTVSVVVESSWSGGTSSSVIHTAPTGEVEFSPNGVSIAGSDDLFFPWHRVQQVYKAT